VGAEDVRGRKPKVTSRSQEERQASAIMANGNSQSLADGLFARPSVRYQSEFLRSKFLNDLVF
jgi:hypothetical protein